MPWTAHIDFADPRPRHSVQVPGNSGLVIAIEAALQDAGIRWVKYDELHDGERTGGYQITVTPWDGRPTAVRMSPLEDKPL